MDVDAGFRVLEGRGTLDEVGGEIFDAVIRTASGERTVSEALGHQEFILTYKSFWSPLVPPAFRCGKRRWKDRDGEAGRKTAWSSPRQRKRTGRATVEHFVREGARVIATDVNRSLLDTLGGCETRLVDVRNTDAIARLAQEFAGIDILFNCAGFVHDGFYTRMQRSDVVRCTDVNVSIDVQNHSGVSSGACCPPVEWIDCQRRFGRRFDRQGRAEPICLLRLPCAAGIGLTKSGVYRCRLRRSGHTM